jgi:hypothetical protein
MVQDLPEYIVTEGHLHSMSSRSIRPNFFLKGFQACYGWYAAPMHVCDATGCLLMLGRSHGKLLMQWCLTLAITLQAGSTSTATHLFGSFASSETRCCITEPKEQRKVDRSFYC